MIDKFFEGNAKDCCMYPKDEEIMLALRTRLGSIPPEVDRMVNAKDLSVSKHLRERRNRKAGYIREALHNYICEHPTEKISAEGMLQKTELIIKKTCCVNI